MRILLLVLAVHLAVPGSSVFGDDLRGVLQKLREQVDQLPASAGQQADDLRKSVDRLEELIDTQPPSEKPRGGLTFGRFLDALTGRPPRMTESPPANSDERQRTPGRTRSGEFNNPFPEGWLKDVLDGVTFPSDKDGSDAEPSASPAEKARNQRQQTLDELKAAGEKEPPAEAEKPRSKAFTGFMASIDSINKSASGGQPAVVRGAIVRLKTLGERLSAAKVNRKLPPDEYAELAAHLDESVKALEPKTETKPEEAKPEQ